MPADDGGWSGRDGAATAARCSDDAGCKQVPLCAAGALLTILDRPWGGTCSEELSMSADLHLHMGRPAGVREAGTCRLTGA